MEHQFLLQPGSWVGEGKVTFNVSSEVIRFYTKWILEKGGEDGMKALQEVEMQGINPNMFNNFLFYNIEEGRFEVSLENELIGKVLGKGVIDQKTIAWEFHATGNLEGFEVYELQDNGDYLLHAEYSSADQFRTIIDGRLWKKSN